jgi:aspartate/methionine/tyrosine aminotransferase
MTKLDMSWGSPEFLQPIWNHITTEEEISLKAGKYQWGSNDELKEQILALHEAVHGLDRSKYDVVVANGATQALQAVVWALNGDDGVVVGAKAPYFSRFPFLVNITGANWNPKRFNTQIVTSPNNPTGRMQAADPGMKKVIYDFSYNWPQYTEKLRPLTKDIMVFSMAKATGHADLRIGWVLVKKKRGNITPTVLEYFIEHSTMGVSSAAQATAHIILGTVTEHNDSFFNGAAAKLNDRWLAIQIIRKQLPFSVLNTQGMFLWCKGECPEELQCVPGSELGMKEDGFFRLNIGCSDETFDRFMELYG